MDEEAFVRFLKRGGRSQGVVERVTVQVAEFKRYLRTERDRTELDKATPADLEAFILYAEERRPGSSRKYLHSIHYYYDYASNEEMRNLAGRLRKQRITQAPFPLRDFRGVSSAHVKKLATLGIRNVKDMLKAGRTRETREELSLKAGIPTEIIMELVKLSDLARIQGVKGVRARLYYDAGVDTIEKMAGWDSKRLRAMLIDFVKETGFEGIAPLTKEAESTVAEARRLPKMVEY